MDKLEKTILTIITLTVFCTVTHFLLFKFIQPTENKVDTDDAKIRIEKEFDELKKEGKLRHTYDSMGMGSYYTVVTHIRVSKSEYFLQHAVEFLSVLLCFTLMLLYVKKLKEVGLPLINKVFLTSPFLAFFIPLLQESFSIISFDIAVLKYFFIPFFVMFIFALSRKMKRECIWLFTSMLVVFAPLLIRFYMKDEFNTIIYYV